MMRTSNFFPLARRYSKQKARSRVQSTTNGGKALDRAFSLFARHGRALTGVSPEHAQVVGNV